MNDQFLRRLISTIKCGVCGQRYEAPNINILGHQSELWFLAVYCSSCKSHGLVAAVVKENRIPKIVRELKNKEMTDFRLADAVSMDDVLDIHNFLKEFDGDFNQLFAKEGHESKKEEELP